jgi:hypothetical protein
MQSIPDLQSLELVGWLAGWLAGWLVGWLAGWLAGWLVGWLLTGVRINPKSSRN